MAVELRVRTALVFLGGVLVVLATGSVVFAETGTQDVYEEPEDAMVYFDDGTVVWPYTSQHPDFDGRTLSINLVIHGDIDLTEPVLRDVPFGDWSELPEEREDVAPLEYVEGDVNETAVAWGGAAGADRWIWVDPPNSEPRWLGEAYQLEQGDYLGERHHVRAYEDPAGGQWTALQAHAEHWDWFHLRHTVHSIEESQLALEEVLIDQWYVETLTRERWGNDASSDADGWVTVIELRDIPFAVVLSTLVVGLAGIRTADLRAVSARLETDPAVRRTIQVALLVGGIVLLYHLVRFGAIGVERQLPTLNPKVIVAVWYPVLVVGLPVLAYLAARPLDATMAFSAASIGFVAAVFLDYTYLGVVAIPLETFVHRGAFAVAIGLIAAGASETAREPSTNPGFVRSGVLLWIVATGVPLLQFL